MKKFLLMIAVALSATAMNAQTWVSPALWTKSLTPVSAADQLSGTNVCVAADGSVYTTGTYNKDFVFAGKTIANPDELTSAYVAKYSDEGAEEWAVTLFGAATISSIDCDADGNAFITGTFQDEVVITGADGGEQKLSGSTVVSAYVAKVSKDGAVAAVKTYTSEVNPEILAIEADPWGLGVMSSVYESSFNDPVYVRPSKIQVDGDKVYVAAKYVGDVKDLGWKGAYQNYYDMMIVDLRSFGIFSLNASDLGDAQSVATVQATGVVLYGDGNYPESLTFVAEAGEVYTAFTGFNGITLTTAAGAQDFTMPSRSVVVAKVGGEAKLFGVQGHEKSYITDAVNAMAIDCGQLYVGGSFYDQLPFDNTVVAKGTDLYVAALNPADLSVNWTAVSAYEEADPIQQCEVFKNLVVKGEKIYFSGVAQSNDAKETLSLLNFNVTDAGVISVAEAADYACIDDNDSGQTALIVNADGTTTVAFCNSDVLDEEPVVDPNLIEIPQDQGKQYDDFARAELIEGEEYNTYTVNENLQIAFKMMDVDVKDCDYVVVKFAEPVAAGWKLAFWSNQDLVDVPEGATEFKYVFADDPKCGVTNGVLPQICMMTFFGGFTAPLEAKVVGIYKHVAGVADAIEDVEAAAPVNGKFIENGKVVIIKNGKKFNMAGVAIQ